MGEVKIFVRDVLTKEKIETHEFVRNCVIEGMSHDTAYRLARGEKRNYSLDTIVMATKALKRKSISEVVDIEDGEH